MTISHLEFFRFASAPENGQMDVVGESFCHQRSEKLLMAVTILIGDNCRKSDHHQRRSSIRDPNRWTNYERLVIIFTRKIQTQRSVLHAIRFNTTYQEGHDSQVALREIVLDFRVRRRVKVRSTYPGSGVRSDGSESIEGHHPSNYSIPYRSLPKDVDKTTDHNMSG